MLRTLGIVIGGMFVGAVVMEVINKRCPRTMDKLYAKVDELAAAMKEGFREGYQSTGKSEAAAEV